MNREKINKKIDKYLSPNEKGSMMVLLVIFAVLVLFVLLLFVLGIADYGPPFRYVLAFLPAIIFVTMMLISIALDILNDWCSCIFVFIFLILPTVLFTVGSHGYFLDPVRVHNWIYQKGKVEAAKVETRQQEAYLKNYLKTPAGQLEVKLNDMAGLRQKLEEKDKEALRLRDYYGSKIRSHKKEISDIRNRKGISSFQGAMRDLKIRNNLTLIQSELAYIAKLDQIRVRIRKGSEELLYLERQTRDDIDIINVLGEKEIGELVKSIDRAIERYLPDAGELAIDIGGIRMKSQERIWNDIVNGRL